MTSPHDGASDPAAAPPRPSLGRLAFVPASLALLPQWRAGRDAVAPMSRAARAATAWLLEQSPASVQVVGGAADPANVRRGVDRPQAERIGEHLLAEAGWTGPWEYVVQPGPSYPPAEGVLVVGDGSARRGDTAPGYVDPRSFGFDDAITAALKEGDAGALAALDVGLAAELLATGAPALRYAGDLALGSTVVAELDYADDPFGVMYWVARWRCAS